MIAAGTPAAVNIVNRSNGVPIAKVIWVEPGVVLVAAGDVTAPNQSVSVAESVEPANGYRWSLEYRGETFSGEGDLADSDPSVSANPPAYWRYWGKGSSDVEELFLSEIGCHSKQIPTLPDGSYAIAQLDSIPANWMVYLKDSKLCPENGSCERLQLSP